MEKDDKFIRLINWVVTDGCLLNHIKYKKYRVQWKLSKPRKIERLVNLLEYLKLPHTVRKASMSPSNKLQPYVICIYGCYAKEIYEALNYTKEYPLWILQEDITLINTFLDEFQYTDGWLHDGAIVVATSKEVEARFIEKLSILTKRFVSFKTQDNSRGFNPKGVLHYLRIKEKI